MNKVNRTPKCLLVLGISILAGCSEPNLNDAPVDGQSADSVAEESPPADVANGRIKTQWGMKFIPITISEGKTIYLQVTEVDVQSGHRVTKHRKQPIGFPDRRFLQSFDWYEDVESFLRDLNESDTEYQYRLPTATEWLAACRLGNPDKKINFVNKKIAITRVHSYILQTSLDFRAC